MKARFIVFGLLSIVIFCGYTKTLPASDSCPINDRVLASKKKSKPPKPVKRDIPSLAKNAVNTSYNAYSNTYELLVAEVLAKYAGLGAGQSSGARLAVIQIAERFVLRS